MSLGRNEPQLATGPLDRLAHEQCPSGEIDVLPTEAEYLSPSEAGRERQDEDALEVISVQLAKWSES